MILNEVEKGFKISSEVFVLIKIVCTEISKREMPQMLTVL